MKILKYKKLNDNRYELEIEGMDNIILYDNVILKHELLLNKEIEPSKLTELMAFNEELESYYIALKFITIKMRTKKELRTYLKNKGYGSESIKKTIIRLNNEGYLNESDYIKAFINDSIKFNVDGPLKIKKKLLNLGLDANLIDLSLSEIDNIIWQDKVKNILNKKSNNVRVSQNLWKNKMQNYFYTLGYDNSFFINELEQIEIPVNDLFLKKEAIKYHNKLKKKYQLDELLFQVKMKLRARGYNKEDIENILKQIKTSD